MDKLATYWPILLFTGFLLFFLLRELHCWYFKINETQANLKSIKEELVGLRQDLSGKSLKEVKELNKSA